MSNRWYYVGDKTNEQCYNEVISWEDGFHELDCLELNMMYHAFFFTYKNPDAKHLWECTPDNPIPVATPEGIRYPIFFQKKDKP